MSIWAQSGLCVFINQYISTAPNVTTVNPEPFRRTLQNKYLKNSN